jgi:NTP pyrophosphatase (non-canonical NTP hydrolase)
MRPYHVSMAATVAEWQRQTDEWIRRSGGYWSPLSQYTRLVEEVGELGRELNHRYGDKPRQAKDTVGSLSAELGDVAFVLLLLANGVGVDLQVALEQTIAKYDARSTAGE